MTYAWFSGEASSGSNTLVSGYFDLDVSVTNMSTPDIITPIKTDETQSACTYKLSAGTYTIVLDLNNDSRAKGYCIVKIGDVEKHTDVITGKNTANREEYEPNAPFQFTLVVEENDTVVEFIEHWGVSATSSIQNGKTYSTVDWKNPFADSMQDTGE